MLVSRFSVQVRESIFAFSSLFTVKAEIIEREREKEWKKKRKRETHVFRSYFWQHKEGGRDKLITLLLFF